ncbi:M20/M25/M40 family metallo-hydrolase [Candidatus Bathyarchaeota archaeon]|nr:M20/M25/M40 family metallo-hydrolase [Candidatus Bathyarchaeota archaeon]
MQNYVIDLLTKMLEIYSPSGRETKLTEFLFSKLEELGYDTKIDEIGNLVGSIGEGNPTILLCSHLDTVPGFIPVKVKNGFLYGRGAVDAKASLASMIVAGANFAAHSSQGRVLIAGVVDEERKSRGIKYFVKKPSSIHYAIFGEPSGVQNITIGYKGSLHFKITCRTPSGHSSAPWMYTNAIEKAFEVWKTLETSLSNKMKGNSLFYSLTTSLTKIRGGTNFNIIPGICEIHIDVRVPPPFKCEDIKNEAQTVLQQFHLANPEVNINLKILDQNEPFETNGRSKLVHALTWAIREVTGKPAKLLRKTGTGDMNILGNQLKIPVVTYGPGDSHLDHAPNEHIAISEVLKSVKIYEKTLAKLVELHLNP